MPAECRSIPYDITSYKTDTCKTGGIVSTPRLQGGGDYRKHLIQFFLFIYHSDFHGNIGCNEYMYSFKM